MFIENEGQGLIFDNSEGKDKNDNAPDFTGQINVGGEQYRVALWWKDFANGEGFSVNVQPVDGNFTGNSSSDEDEDEEEEVVNTRSSRGRSSAPARKPTGRATSKPSQRTATASKGKTAYKKPSRVKR